MIKRFTKLINKPWLNIKRAGLKRDALFLFSAENMGEKNFAKKGKMV